jgi:uncharacterized protein (TIGR02391 family)
MKKNKLKIKVVRVRQKQLNKLTPRLNQLLEQFSEKIGEIIPATSPMGKGLSFKNIAKEKKLLKYWKDLSNKKATLSFFFKNLFKYKPIVFRKIIRDNISKGIDRRIKQGNPILVKEMEAISLILFDLGINMKKDLKELKLPKDKPLITPPPTDFQKLINKIGLDPFFDECKKKYLIGDFKNSVREAFEKIETLVQQITGLTTLGKSLMGSAFNTNSTYIKIKSPTQSNWSSRQEGFMYLTMGSMQYIRNPFSHGDEPQPSHNEAFELLCLANHLYRNIIAKEI